ncbi:putative N-acetyltransferase YlbP [Bacillus sp. J14TS2]|uniref:N-acetyltransferase n=1 Tax=Bacillus sp. J14TS2 TaxID=2807188 RepID=UPI001B00B9A0|nr:N-acetyltransferase [Bacillus sp. J14TS2]GIN74384.1 putative N-acetyltransferase YlbP [Bacillus sp. J14TS2]
MPQSVKKLKINFKTLEEFKQFKEFGIQELSMIEDLQSNMIEDNSYSPFYGIYFGDKLVARMSLYQHSAKYDQYFNPPQAYLEIWKLEVLPGYQKMGFGKALIEYAKSYQMPLKTNPRMNSRAFFERMGFDPIHYEIERDRGEEPFVWCPKGVTFQSF